MRWQAAHCVRRLSEYSCTSEIKMLVERIHTNGVGPWGSNQFPFYGLHAQLYLLIGLSRVAVDDSTCLRPYAKEFLRIALQGAPHVLIQKWAANIALSIETKFPRTFLD